MPMEVQPLNPLIQECSSPELRPSPELSAKHREKLVQLSAWRIDPSTIQFNEGGTEVIGGFASVSRASLLYRENSARGAGRDPEDVAVKKMCIGGIGSREKVLGLALREARLLVELSHDNIVQLRGFVENISGDQIWLVFPWASNGNVRDFIALADWEVPERVWLIRDVITGLEYLHTRGPAICHGDLKSVNILVDSQCRAILTDFGSARRVQPKEVKVNEEPSTSARRADETEDGFEATVNELENTMTLTGNKFTLRWAAPELLADDQAGPEADIWAFGWVCYEVMTGQIPFSETLKSTAITLRIFQGELPSLDDDVRMSLIRRLGSLMVSCWRMASAERPTATECKKSIGWLPMCAPRSPQSLGTRIANASLPLWLGYMYMRQHNTIKALDAFNEAFRTARQAEDRRLQAEALMGLADAHRWRNEYGKSVPLYEQCLQIHEETGNRNGKATALWGLADIHRMRNESAKAVPLYEECVQIHEETGNRNSKATALWGLADIHRMREEYAQAVPLYKQCVQIREETGDRNGIAEALHGLAEIHRMQDEYAQAVPLHEECLRVHEETGDRNGKANALWGLASVHRMRDEYAQAILLFQECVKIREETGNPNGKADALWGIASVYEMQNEYAKAFPLYEECLRIREETGNRSGKADALRGLASVYEMRNEYAKAILLYEECVQISEETGNRNGKANALRGLANVYEMRNEYAKAVSLYEECVQIHEETGNRCGQAYALWDLAEVLADRGKHNDTVKMYQSASALFEEIGFTDEALETSTEAEAIRKQHLSDSNP